MDLRKEILKEHSKAQTERIVAWVGNSQQRFDELFSVFVSGDYRLTQRAAWPLSYCAIRHPGLIRKHFGKLMKLAVKKDAHNAIRRNIMRLLPYVPIPAKCQGEVMDLCFQYISDPAEKVAVKAFSLQTLQGLIGVYPEIAGEVRAVIEYRWDNESPAFRSRARKVLAVIDSL